MTRPAIESALSRLLGRAHDICAAPAAALELLSGLGYDSPRTGPTYSSPDVFLRDFPVIENVERALLDVISCVAILFQWTAEDMARIVGGNVVGGESILFILVLVKPNQDIDRLRCEKWAKQIRRAFGPRRDMSLAILFVQGGIMVFAFTYLKERGGAWDSRAQRKISLDLVDEGVESMENLSINALVRKIQPTSIDSVRQFWLNSIQEEFSELYLILQDVLHHGLTTPGQLFEIANILLTTDKFFKSEDLDSVVGALDRTLNRQGIPSPRFPELLWSGSRPPPENAEEFLALVRAEIEDESWPMMSEQDDADDEVDG